MQVISSICIALVLLAMLSAPVFFIVFIVRWCMKKSKKFFGIAALICVGSILPLSIIGAFTDPATYCEHKYVIVEEKPATCTEQGKIVKECVLCERDTVEYTEKASHSWKVDSAVPVSCAEGGYVLEKCTVCSATQEVDVASVVGHSWKIDTTVPATCTKSGYVVKKCTVCAATNEENTEAALGHSWQTDKNVPATCTKGGYAVKKCTVCSATQKTDTEVALGHSMKEVSRKSATYEVEGEIVNGCERCDYEEYVIIEKLELEIIEFDGLELTFGQYSFTTVDSKFSQYYGKSVVKIPVTIKNISEAPNSLWSWDYQLFGSSGAESEDVSYYFSDDVYGEGDLLPGKSYTKYFHIIYDGDGVYTILFDVLWGEDIKVEIEVTK